MAMYDISDYCFISPVKSRCIPLYPFISCTKSKICLMYTLSTEYISSNNSQLSSYNKDIH